MLPVWNNNGVRDDSAVQVAPKIVPDTFSGADTFSDADRASLVQPLAY